VTRDPRKDPKPGDWLTDGKTEIRIDDIGADTVFFARFDAGAAMASALVQISLADFLRLASEPGVRCVS